MDSADHLSHADVRNRARTVASMAVGCGHLGLFVLAATNTLAYTVPTGYRFLASLADSHVWLIIHLTIAAMIGVSLVLNRWQIRAMSVSAGFMGAWGIFTLSVGLTAVRPVSLASPILALTLAGVAYGVAGSWATSKGGR